MGIKPSKKPVVILSAAVIVVVGVVLVTIGGFAFAASQESHDSFCASCHTQPESTFYQRSTAGQAADLASFHTAKTTGCIDCHSGAGITGRVSAELLGASNALKWYTGTSVQPAQLKVPIGDANCLKCHQDVIARGFQPKEAITSPVGGGGGFGGDREGRNNHWHQMLAQWQAASSSAGSCSSCHSGHATGGTAANGFMDSQAVQSTCDACHQVLRHEGAG